MYEQLDTTSIISKAERLIGMARHMEKILDDTTSKTNVVGTSDEVWNSNAAQSFRSKYDALSRKFDEFIANIIAYADFLKTNVAEGYDEADRRAQKELENI